MPWLFTEDREMKAKVSGLSIIDTNGKTLPVTVRFRLPETEVADVNYPLIVIEHAGFFRAPEREHRGVGYLPYTPEGWAALPNNEQYSVETPIPYDVHYQIRVQARKAVHIQALRALLAGPDYLPSRFGYLDIPEDSTYRRLDLLGGPEPNEAKDADGKRLFEDVYLLAVSTEYLPTQAPTLESQVASIQFNFIEYVNTYGPLIATQDDGESDDPLIVTP